MANFLISPGVLTREVDNSQYAATNPGLGNMAALIGYAEKGPFTPTIVNSQQDFVETFGKTLEEAPYLAQAAYKYFEENDALLVVRAGNNQDPVAYPQAAQYSSIKVRLDPQSSSATAGYQSFSQNENISPGTFGPGANYSFRVLGDWRAFNSPKYLEKWQGLAVETASSMGPSPVTSISNTVFKIATSGAASNSFEAHYKRLHSSGGTAEYYGTGTRTGTSFSDTVTATLYKYHDSGTYAHVSTDFITVNGVYGAAVEGTENVQPGFDFASSNGEFKITIGSEQYTVTLDQMAVDSDALVAEINAKLAVAEDSVGSVIDLTPWIIGERMVKTGSEEYITLKKVGGTGNGFTLSAGTTAPTNALTVFGWEAREYLDSNSLTGTWHAETIVSNSPETFSGNFVFDLTRTESSAISFEEPINVTVTAPSTGAWELSDIVTQINSELDIAYDGSHTDDGLAYSTTEARMTASLGADNKIRITADENAGDMASIVSISQPAGGNSLLSLLGGVETATEGQKASSVGESLYTLKAAEKGSYGQKLVFRTETQKVTLGLQQFTYYNIYILLDGYEVRTYQKVVWDDPEDPNFILTRMADDQYIEFEADDEDEDLVFARLPDGDWKLGSTELPEGVNSTEAEIVEATVGTNGWTATGGVITSMSADLKNALLKLYNPEVYEFNLVAAPGSADPIVQNAIQDLCESRKDCFGIVDAAPFGIGLGIKDGVSDVTEVTSSVGTLNSSYVGAFWPWLQDYDADNQQYLWLPPSIYALKAMVYTDNVSDPWFAPAGTTRGKVSALDVEYSPSRTDRDLLYGDTNIVNPIVYFVGEGITIWGQKTAQRTRSATDRINVRRLLIYAEKLVAKMARGFLFEPNDSAQWAAFTRRANAILEPIRQRRGLYQYSVVCDETTNTPDLINQNIMAGKIFVQPTKTTEFIEVEFTINAAGDVSVTE